MGWLISVAKGPGVPGALPGRAFHKTHARRHIVRDETGYSRTVTLLGDVRSTPEQIGKQIRDTRKSLGVTQKNLALTSGTGLRFIIDLEKGKETCEIGKALRILQRSGSG